MSTVSGLKGLSPRVRDLWVIGVLHLIAWLGFGATFWVDTVAYVDPAVHFFEKQGYQSLAASYSHYFYQHILPGLPLLWGFFHFLFGRLAWLPFSAVQHGIAVLSLWCFLNAIREYVGPRITFFAAALICLNPFYESMHNAILTESISGSAILLALAFSVEMASRKDRSVKSFGPLMALCACMALYRTDVFLMVLGLMGATLFYKRANAVVYLCAAAVIFASVIVAPLIRFSRTGVFYFPNSDYVNIYHAVNSNPFPTPGLQDYINALDMPLGFQREYARFRQISFPDLAIKWTYHLRDKGWSDKRIRDYFRVITQRICFDSSKAIVNRFVISLPSVGFVFLSPALFIQNTVYADMNAKQLLLHNRRHLDWLSWQQDGVQDVVFDQLIPTMRSQAPSPFLEESLDQTEQSLRPFMPGSFIVRRMFGLFSLPPDLIAVAAIVVMGILFRKRGRRFFAVLVFLLIILRWLPMVKIGLGNIRYYYQLMPVYIALTSILVGSLAGRLRDRLKTRSWFVGLIL